MIIIKELINNISKVLFLFIIFKLSLFQFDILNYTTDYKYIFLAISLLFHDDIEFLVYYSLFILFVIILFDKFKYNYKYINIVTLSIFSIFILLNYLSILYMNRTIYLYDFYNFSISNINYIFNSIDFKFFILFIIPIIIYFINFNKILLITFSFIYFFNLILNTILTKNVSSIYKESYVTQNLFSHLFLSIFDKNKYLNNIDKYEIITIKKDIPLSIPIIAKPSNIFIFSLESVNYKYFTKENSPFLFSLMDNSINFKNLYTNYPYTKDSLVNLYCGNDFEFFTIKNSNKIEHKFNETNSIINKLKDLNYKVNFTTSGIASLNGSFFNNNFFEKNTNFKKIKNIEPYNYDIYNEYEYLNNYLNDVKPNEINGYLTSMTHWPYYSFDNDKNNNKISIDNYIKSIKTQDEYFKILFEKHPVLKDSLILFVADHGQGFGEHNFLTHGELYNEVLHIPGFIYYKDLKRFDVDEFYSTSNLLPSIYSLLTKEKIKESIFDDKTNKYIISFNLNKISFINKENKEKYLFKNNECIKYNLNIDIDEKNKLICDNNEQIKEMFNHIEIKDY